MSKKKETKEETKKEKEEKEETITETNSETQKKSNEKLYTLTELLEKISDNDKSLALMNISANGYFEEYMKEINEKERGITLTPIITKKEFNKIIR